MNGINEYVVVVDGSTDDTLDYLGTVDDPRLRVVVHHANKGLPAARNTGALAASGEWVVFGEDDCWFPPEYAEVLLGEAIEFDADIVGAPWLNVLVDQRERAFREGRSKPVEHFTLSTHPSSFPVSTLRTPFMPALSLVRRTVFEELRYSELYRGNAFREETDFYLMAVAAGFVCVLTPATASYQLLHASGGARTGRLRYEWYVARNTHALLRRHRAWMRANGHCRSVTGAVALQTGRRVRALMASRFGGQG